MRDIAGAARQDGAVTHRAVGALAQALAACVAVAACGPGALSGDSDSGAAAAEDAASAGVPGAPAAPGADPTPYRPWSLIVLPDTQAYAFDHPELFAAQTAWIAANADALGVRYVLHVGDVTEWNTTDEWLVARGAFDALDGVVPYAIVPGNHDYDLAQVRASRLTEFFGVEDARAMPTFGGTYEAGRLDSSFHTFDVAEERWLILALEWGPRPDVLAWAGAVLDAHPDHRAIVLTHAYLYGDDTRYDWTVHGDAQTFSPHFYPLPTWPEVTDGEQIWQALIAPRDQVHLVLSGHVVDDGVGRLTSTTDAGAQVHQLLANYQDRAHGGAAYLRILTFFEHAVQVRTYSPWLDAFDDAPDQQFVLPRDGW